MSETTSPARANTLRAITRNTVIGVGATALAMLAPEQSIEHSAATQPIQTSQESYQPTSSYVIQAAVFHREESLPPTIVMSRLPATSRVEKRSAQPKAECWDGKLSDLSHTHAKSLGNIALACQLAVNETWYRENPKKEITCLVYLWDRESGWSPTSHNKSSGAHGIPQAMPGEKMKKYGNDWFANPATQIKWGFNYIDGRYGSPCNALNDWNKQGWY